MRIHSLRVANFKGIDERTVEFPENGVVVVEGPNEVGKSSMIEALHLLLGKLDSSKKAKIKEAKPVDRDVGPEVEAEIESGKYRFRYFKRFLKKPETVLRILAPQKHDLTGRTAHERVDAILDESMDRVLWDALQVTQADPLTQASLAQAQSLAAALDQSAGQEIAGDRESTLFTRVESEYARYFTPTGKPGKALQEAEARAEDAQATLDETTEKLLLLEQDVAAIDRLEKDTVRLETQHRNQLTAHAERVKELDELRQQESKLEGLAMQASAAAASATASRNADEARRRRIESAEAAQRRCAELETQAKAREPELREAEEVANAANEQLATANSAAAELRRVAELRERDKNHLHYQLDLQKMRERRKAIDEDRERRAKATAELEENRVDEAAARRIREAHDALQRAEAQAQTRSPQLFVRAHKNIAIELDGERHELKQDSEVERTVGDRLKLSIHGILDVEFRGGAGTRELQDAIRQRRDELTAILETAGVASLEDAEAALRARAECHLVLEQCDRQIAQNLADLTYESLVDKIERTSAAGQRYMAERPSDPEPAPNYDAAVTMNREARAAATAADIAQQDARARADAAREKFAERKDRTERSRFEIQLAQRELEKERTLLEQERLAKPDDALAKELEAAVAKASATRDAATTAERALGAGRVLEARQLADNAEKAAARTNEERTDVRDRLRDTRNRIEMLGGDGLFESEQRAHTLVEHAARERDDLQTRAAAARLLYDTMVEEQAAARSAYAAPLRDKIGQLGRLVYHESFAVQLDHNTLSVRQRTLRGRTIPFDSLSVGAREQLGMITRLAVALLVDEEHGVPVVLDDTLGSTDPERLEGLGAMLNVAGQRAQIIVLTCTPDRFRHVGDAKVIRLS